MIEQAMYFALGFLAAGLFTLMFLPAFWRRAMRLSLRRLRCSTPLSLEKMAAERDLLRAEFAARYRGLEQKMEAVRSGKAADMLAIGEGVARIADLDGQLAAATARGDLFVKKFEETKGFLEERTELLRSTELALHDMTDRVEQLIGNLRNVETDREQLGRLTELHRTQVATHELSIAGLHVQNAEMRQRLDALQDELARALGRGAAARRGRRRAGADDARARRRHCRERRSAAQARRDGARLAGAGAQRHDRDRDAAIIAARRPHRGARPCGAARSGALRQCAAAGGGGRAAPRARAFARERRPENAGHAALAPGEGEHEVLALRQAIIDLGARMAEMSATPPSANSNEAAQSKRA